MFFSTLEYPAPDHLFSPLDNEIQAIPDPLFCRFRRTHNAGSPAAVIVNDGIIQHHLAGIQKTLIGEILVVNFMSSPDSYLK